MNSIQAGGLFMIRFFLLFFLCGVLMADLPEYKPPFSSGTMKRLPPELKVDSFLRNGKTYEQPYFLIGNKRIGLRRLYNQDRVDRDFIIGIQVDGKDVFHIRFWGSLPGGNSGWPFRDGEDKGTILVDRAAKTITYRKSWRLPDGIPGVFSFTIRPAGDGSVEILWNPGVSRGKLAAVKGYSLAPWLEFPFSTAYRTRKITIDGTDLIPSPPERFSGTGAKKSVRSFQGTVSSVEFDRFSAGKKISVQLPGKLPGSLYESFYENAAGEKQFQAVLQLRINPLEKNRRIRIDFGSGVLENKSPSRSPELTSGRTMQFMCH